MDPETGMVPDLEEWRFTGRPPNPEGRWPTLKVRLHPDLLDRVKVAAKTEGIAAAALARRAILAELDPPPPSSAPTVEVMTAAFAAAIAAAPAGGGKVPVPA